MDAMKKISVPYPKLWLIPFASFLIALLCFPFLSNNIPTHWDNNWNPNGWGTKWFIFLIPTINGILLYFAHYPLFIKSEIIQNLYYHPFFLVLSLIFFAVNLYVILYGFYHSVSHSRFMVAAVAGAALVFAGNYAKARPHFLWILEIAGLLIMTTNLIV